MIIPKPLFTGARVALIAPSGPVPEGRLEPAVASVQALGLEPVVFPSCTMRHGYLAGYDRERAADFNNAFSDAEHPWRYLHPRRIRCAAPDGPHRLDCYCKNAQGVLWVQ